MHPVLLETRLFGLLATPWRLHAYGVLLAFGFLVGLVLAARRARVEGADLEHVLDLGFFALLAGLFGAWLVFVLTAWRAYLDDPFALLAFWRGGLVWYGGVLGAALYVAHDCRRHRQSFWAVGDLLIPYVALGHAMGRLGCFFAGCCHGAATVMPWGVVFPPGAMAQQAQASAGLVDWLAPSLPVHPTQLYEAALELALFGGLVLWRARRRFVGQLVLLWLVGYGLGRFVIEQFRGDEERGVCGLSTSQYIAIALVLLAFSASLRLRRGPQCLMRPS